MTPPRPAPSSRRPDGRARCRAAAAARCRQRRSANGQRGAKRQPGGLAVGAGHRALDGGEPLAVDVDAAGSSRAGRSCRDAAGSANRSSTSALSTIRPAYITSTPSAISAMTPRSWVMIRIAMPSRRCRSLQQVEDLGLDGDVERGGRLVGDQQRRLAGQRHRDHHALAHAARQLVRIVVEPLRRRRDAHQLEHLDRARSAPPAATSCVWRQDRLDDLLADRVDRVERGHRLLEDHRHLAAAQPAPLVGRQPQQVAVARTAPPRPRPCPAGSAPAP